MSEELSHILAECIEAIGQSRLTLDECLDAYPRHRVELNELLSVVVQARAMPTAYAPTEFRQEARGQLMAKLPPRSAASNGRVSGYYLLGARVIGPTLSQGVRAVRQKAAHWWPFPLRPSLVAGAVLLFVVILVATLWLRGQSPASQESQLAQENPASPVVKTEAAMQDGDVSEDSDVIEEGSGESAGAIPAGQKFLTVLPVIAIPLNLDAQTAIVEVSQGIVEVRDAAGEWLIVNRATTVTAGQRMRTGAFSGATVTFYDGSQASLQSNTELSLDQLDAQRPEDGLREVVMTQWVGESEHRVDFRNDAGSRYEVRTPNGSGRARGTVFQVIVTPEQVSQYIVTEGRVDVTHLNVTVMVAAGQVSLVGPEEPPSQPYFIIFGQGEVTAMGESWTIGGQTFATTDSTTIVGDPQLGDIVSVYGYMLPDGVLVATHILLRHHTPANHFTLTGIVERIGVNEWIVAGRTVAVNEETIIDDTVVVGDLVRVHGVILTDDGTFLAQRIDRVDEAFDFEFVGVVQSIASGTWNISGLDIAIDDGTEIEGEITVGDVVEVEGEILAGGTWLAHEIHLHDEGDEVEFEFAGRVESIDPWLVAGISFETDAYTKVDGGIDVGHLVHVEGQILADGTWLATEIRLASDDALTFALIGVVDSIDPWVVSGVPLAVDGDTLIDDEILLGDLVRAQGLILSDGTLLAALIERFDEDPAGCYTLTTTVIDVNDNQVTLKGLPTIILDDSSPVDGDIAPNAIVTVSVCFAEDGSVIIISIVVVVSTPAPPGPPPSSGTGPGNGGYGYVTICHKPDTPAEKTKVLPQPALNGHLGHGDTLGPCR